MKYTQDPHNETDQIWLCDNCQSNMFEIYNKLNDGIIRVYCYQCGKPQCDIDRFIDWESEE